jgi:hypothetical protein
MRPSLTDLIGALEIGAGLQFDVPAGDGTNIELEVAMSGPPATFRGSFPGCTRIDDDALKAASVTAGPTQTRYPPCRFIGDEALEVAAAELGAGPSQVPSPICRHIDDGALERTVLAGPPPGGHPPTLPRLLGGHCLTDGALEGAAGSQPPVTAFPYCHHIDDIELEHTVLAGPQNTHFPYCPHHIEGDRA